MTNQAPSTQTVRVNGLDIACSSAREAAQVRLAGDAYSVELDAISARRAAEGLSAVQVLSLESDAWERTMGAVV